MRLLAFDDDAAIGRLVTRVASLAGMQASAVTNPESFRNALRDTPPQIVALDLQLGNTDGIEQLRYLAAQGFHGSVILMSGFDARVLDTAGALARNLGLSVAGTLMKPIRVADLEQVLEQVQAATAAPALQGLLTASRQGELMLEFEPIVGRRPRTLERLDVLVWWEHPTAGWLAAAAFLAAEDADPAAVDEITDGMFRAVAAAWRVLDRSGAGVPLAMHICDRNLHDLALPDRLEAQLAAAGMPATRLWLEIAESAAFHDATHVMDVLARLRIRGVQLAIDRFGTAYSSLKLLRQMPLSAIKIDRSFVADLATSRDSRAIVKSIIDLAANMELESVAEGVETEAVAALLEQMGVGALQGRLIAPPMPLEAVPGWLAVWRAAGG